MPDAPPTTLPNVDLQGYTPPSYKPLNQADVAAVTNPPPPVFQASNTDIQAVAGTQKTVIPAAPPVFGSNPPQAQTGQVQPTTSTADDSQFPARIQAVGGKDPQAFVVHHTGGRLSLDGLTSTLKERGLGVEYFMDRGDKTRGPRIYVTGGSGAQNILPGWGEKGANLNNSNIVGMEISANDDGDVTDAQQQLFSKFMASRYPTTNILGHGEVNPGHKEWNEGLSAKNAALKYRASITGQPQPATVSASGTAITPGQPSSDPGKLQIGPSGPIPAPPVPGLTATDAGATTAPGDTIKQLNAGGLNATRYGYEGDKYADPESMKGNGAFVKEGGLVSGYDVALNDKARAMVGNPKPGAEFQYAGRIWRYGDTVPEKYPDARFDIYDKNGQFADAVGGEGKAAQVTAQTQPQTTQPSAFGMRVASPDEANKYDKFIQNGGDPNTIPVYDRLAVAIAKDPNFLTKPENIEEFYGLVYKPLQAQNAGELFNKALQNIAPGMWQTFQNIGAAVGNGVAATADLAKMGYQAWTGQGSIDEGTLKDLTQRQASISAGEGQGVSDAYNFLSGVGNGILNLPKPILDSVVGAVSPEAREQMDRGYAGILQNLIGKQQQLQGLGKALQQVSAHAYGQVNAHVGELVAQATPDPKVVAGTAALSNPLNVLPVAEGMEAVAAFKPVFFERAVNLGEEAAGAVAKKAALDSAVLAPSNVMEHATAPGFADAQNVRSQFMPQQTAAGQAVTQTQNDLAAQLTRIGKTEADPSTATGFLSQVMQTGGKMITKGAEGAQVVKDWPEQFGRWASGGNPLIGKVISSVVEKGIFGELLEHMGPLGAGISAVIEHGPELGAQAGEVMSVMGKEYGYGQTSLPYWTRVAQQTKWLPKNVAAALDSPLVQTATATVRGGVAGAATNAALGALSSPLNPIGGAVGGASQGGILGMAGGGFGQWQRFQSPGQYMLAARGDWKRYRDTLPPAEQASFDKLSPANQLIMGQAMQHFPGLNVRYVNQLNGPRGNHFVDPQGRSAITINLANPESAISGIMAHELTHSAATHGQLPDIYKALLGDPRTGQPGQYTLLDGKGNPVGIDPATGHYYTNQEFGNLKNQYISALGQSGIPTSHLTDLHIAREIYAEHGVDYMLSGGAIQDAASAFRGGSISQAAVKTALAKIGYTFDDAGNLQMPTNKSRTPPGSPGQVTGSGLFQDMQRNPTLGKLATTYFQKKFQEGAINSEEMPTRRFGRRDMANPNVAETSLQNASEIRRDADGNVMRDPLTGQPVLRTAAETKEYNAGFAAALQKGIDALSPEQRAEMGHQTTTEGNTFVRYLPNDVLDGLAKSNQYNPHQIASLRMLSNVLADKGNPGMEVSAFYHKALSPGKKYGQFEGSEKTFVPYGIEISKVGNVDVKAVDFNQLNNNYLKARGRAPYKDLWKSPSEFTQDAHTYFVNHSEGRPGADGGLGQAKRDAINALGNFQTISHKETNPLVDSLPKKVESIIKSYRLDRANQMQATGSIRPFISEEQYDKMNTNYLPQQVVEKGSLKESEPVEEIQDKVEKALGNGNAKTAPVPLASAIYLNGSKVRPGKTYSKAQMIKFGADGFLSRGTLEHVPIDKITGRESTEGNQEKGTPITQPIEVEHDPDTGQFTLHSGNQRIAQAEANGDTYISAFVQRGGVLPKKSSGSSDHPTPETPQHAAALAPGTKFLDPNGKLRRVPR